MPAISQVVPFACTAAIRELFENNTSHAWSGEPPLEIKPGDWYWAQRNGPPRILQCKSNNEEKGWIVPTTSAYSYNTTECFRLKEGISHEVIAPIAERVEQEFKAWSGTPAATALT